MTSESQTDRAFRGATVAIILLVGGIGLTGAVRRTLAQEKTAPRDRAHQSAHASTPIKTDDECSRCHTCATPTTDDPCLHPCKRKGKRDFAEEFAKAAPKGVVLLDMLSNGDAATDHFGPVPFDHAGHARWAEIAGGCQLCHHYTPEGSAHPECRTCHEVEFRHEDLRKPGLKGAFHRQCLGCHREWSHETDCQACHLPRIGADTEAKKPDTITKDDAMGTMHPPIAEPDVERYATEYPDGAGSTVYFHHKRHTEMYHFKCAECHRGDSCVRCHEPGKEHVQHVRTLEEHHQPCSACHEIEGACEHCHRQAGQPEPVPFDHAKTGWPLSRYHQGNNCRDCHRAVKFTKLDRNCNACHDDWSSETFDHAVTGQVLDETHKEIDCESCHAGRDFAKPPACDDCHDGDDGFAFPAKRPGPVAGTGPAQP